LYYRWKYRIPFRSLTDFYIKSSMAILMLDPVKKLLRGISKSTIDLWEAFTKMEEAFYETINEENFPDKLDARLHELKSSINITEVEKHLEYLKLEISQDIDLIINDIFEAFDRDFRCAGTIELPRRRYSMARVSGNFKKLNESYAKLSGGWANTFFALYEDWKLTSELSEFIYSTLGSYERLTLALRDRIAQQVLPLADEITNLLGETREYIMQFSGSEEEFKESIKARKDQIAEAIRNKLAPEAAESLISQNLPSLVDDIEVNIKDRISELPPKRAIVKTINYDKALAGSEIDYLSPSELINFESLPQFMNVSRRVKSQIIDKIESFRNDIADLDKIVDYNLESACDAIDRENKSTDEAIGIAVEGIERAVTKSDALKKLLEEIIHLVETDLKNAVDQFVRKINEYKSVEQLFSIKLRITKGKAIAKGREYRTRAMELLNRVVPLISERIKGIAQKSRDLYRGIRKRIGLAPTQAKISPEISNFLAETRRAISLLPFAYRRLFSNTPLPGARFYIGRVSEAGQLDTAIDNWEKERYAPTAIIGEKGSGITTFLNNYFQGMATRHELLRVEVSDHLYITDKLLEFWENILGEEFHNFEAVAEYLNNGHRKHIIVIEHFHHMFMREVGGFECLKKMFELVSNTSRNVFWICTSTRYAWEYLDRTVNASEYFGHMITMGEFTSREMFDLIMTRHRAGGYSLVFEPAESERESKNLQKMNECERQEYLSREYFDTLGKLARSNISSALIYWLRSTKECTSDKIVMSSLKDLDLSFMQTLASAKSFTLLYIILHDRMNEFEYAEVSGISVGQARLELVALYDDGILDRKEGYYSINPLLYRQTVNLLKAKNMI
ncbi:MAG: hypothetical protein ACLFQX_07665, partial [Candidatus Kapaibacterium sp.]